ncbi:MAG: NifB/NifX family molybdenum-iron cluster-binding protein [Sedimentibacter sp.]|uniref:NifB/NifX family molybdenum-iron cluster-binding protein n=1 Tax=Sedimentibacter sp. TaxID=1960295 RepID=UPI0031597AB9
MRIAIPAEDKNMSAQVYQSFGRAPYFLLYNSITKETTFLDNSAVVSQGGAGIRAAQVIADNGTQVLITPRCGENAEKVLRNAEVLVYKAVEGTLKHNINEYFAEKLNLLDEFHEGFHSHGGEK